MEPENNRTKKVEDFLLDPQRVIFEEIQDFKAATDVLIPLLQSVDIANLTTLKGEDGKTPERGADYLTDDDFDILESFILDNMPVVDIDYPSIETINSFVIDQVSKIPRIKGDKGDAGAKGEKGNDGSPDTGSEIIAKIRALDKNKRLKFSDIRGLEGKIELLDSMSEELDTLRKDFDNQQFVIPALAGGGSGSTGITGVSVATANGFAGTSDGDLINPTLTLSTTVTGILKGNGTSVSAAVSGTDYAPATSGTSILKGNGAGGFSNATAGTDYQLPYFSRDTTNGYLYPSTITDKLGIGTNAPTANIHVLKGGTPVAYNATSGVAGFQNNTNVGNDAIVYITAGTSGVASLRFGDSANVQSGRIDYDNTTDSMLFFTNNVQRASILSTGFMGVGTAAFTPLGNLHVLGGGTAASPTNAAQLIVQNSTATSTNSRSVIVSGTAGIALLGFGDTAASEQTTLQHDNSTDFFTVNNAAQISFMTSSRSLIIGNSGGALGFFQFVSNTGTASSNGAMFAVNKTATGWTASTGVNNVVGIVPHINQTGSAGYRALIVSAYQQSTGSGIKRLIDLGTNSAADFAGTHTTLFNVDNTGAVYTATLTNGLVKSTSGVLSNATAGTDYLTPTGSETVTNKDLKSSTNTFAAVTTATSSATPTPTGDSRQNELYMTAQAANAVVAAPTGTPVNGNKLLIRITPTGTYTLGFNAIFEAVGVTLPTGMTNGKEIFIGAVYNSTASKWQVTAVALKA